MIPAGRPLGPPPSTAKAHQLSPQVDQPNSIKVGSPVRLTILDSKTKEKKHFVSKSWSLRQFLAGTKRAERLAVITRIKSKQIHHTRMKRWNHPVDFVHRSTLPDFRHELAGFSLPAWKFLCNSLLARPLPVNREFHLHKNRSSR